MSVEMMLALMALFQMTVMAAATYWGFSVHARLSSLEAKVRLVDDLYKRWNEVSNRMLVVELKIEGVELQDLLKKSKGK